jgi:hypothetical protein
MKPIHNRLCEARPSVAANLLLAILIAAVVACLPIPAAAGSTRTRTGAAQPDIRDIFLSLPFAKDDLEEFQVAQALSDPGQRKALLEKTDFTAGDNVLDVPNGYLRIDIPIRLEGDGEGDPRLRRIVVTYFSKANGDRLVVVQLGNFYEYPDPVLVDSYYLLAKGTYTRQEDSQSLPPISFFGDFWGNQPLPDKLVRDYQKSLGDSAFYNIEWPRKGIVATAHSYVPYCDTDTKEQNRVDRILGRRQFEALQLVWDKNNGVFVKGAKTKDHLNGKKPRGESP